jgi:preprotein translocase subunit SecF
MIDFMGKKKWYLLASGIITLVGIIFLLAFGIPRGIEFTGGTTMTLKFEQQVDQAALRGEFTGLGYTDAVIQKTSEGTFIIRTPLLSDQEVATIKSTLTAKFGEEPTITDVYAVSPAVASEIEGNAAIAVLVAAIGIVIYMTWAFRKLMKPFRYGVCAIVALIHDVLVVLGVFAILGVWLNLEIDAMFITGILTVIGYSVNDTVVVFDRIRENTLKNPGVPLETVVNYSITETLARSLNTSLTTLFVILALLLLGGATIQNFVVVMLIGVITGTYSSISIASPLLVVWEKGTFGRFFRRVIPKRAPARG